MKITWMDFYLYRLFYPDLIPLDARTFLDVGCGKGILGYALRVYREPSEVVGMDGFQPYLDFTDEHKVYSRTIRCDLNAHEIPFPDGYFDMVLCVETIEHLTKESGFKLMVEFERVGRRILISTPNRYLSQGEWDGNPFQKHLSRWTAGDFRSKGYSVIGVGQMHPFGLFRLPIEPRGFMERIPSWADTLIALKVKK